MSGCLPIEDRDYSHMNFPGDFPQPLPVWEVVLKIGSCVLVELVAVFGNLLLIAVVARSPRMRTTINCYIANMAVADLLIALVPMWIHVSTDVISMDKDAWPLGGFLCKFNSFVQVTAMVASVLTLMAIGGDRFFAILFPLKARVTERRVGVVVVVVWLCALGIGLPPLFFYTYHQRQWKDYLETFCTDVWPAITTSSGECDGGLTSKRAYWTVVTVVMNWLPMAVMAVVYALIIHRLRFSRLRPATACDALTAIQRRSKRKLPAWHKPVYYAAVFLMYTNSAINPILYGGLNENFRRGARQLLCSLICRQDTRPRLSASTRLSLSKQPRVSLVENEVLKVKVRKDLKPSLSHLVVSAAKINTALAATDKKRLTEERRTAEVNFDHTSIVINDQVNNCRFLGVTDDGVLNDQSLKDTGEENTAYVGEENTAYVGEENTAYVGEENTAYVGEENTAAGGEENTAYVGEENTAYVGEENTAAGGEENTAYVGEENTAYVGEENTAYVGEENTAGAGEENTAYVGEENTAYVGEENTAAGGEENTAYVGEENTAAGGEESDIAAFGDVTSNGLIKQPQKTKIATPSHRL